MFRMNFPRRFTSRPDFRLRVLPLEIGLSIIADNTPRFLRFSNHASSSFFSNLLTRHLHDYYRPYSIGESRNARWRGTAKKGWWCVKSVSVLGDLDNRGSWCNTWFPFLLETITSFSIIIQFCNVQVLEESRLIIGWKYVLGRKFLLERLIRLRGIVNLIGWNMRMKRTIKYIGNFQG